MMKKVDNFLRKKDGKFTMPEKTNFRFHVAMIAAMCISKKKNYRINDLINLDIKKINNRTTNKIIKLILHSANKFLTAQGGTSDSIAKSKSFLDDILPKVRLK